MNISFWKKLKLFFLFKKILKRNKLSFESQNLRVDRVSRIYTVLNIPDELYGEYNLKKGDIDRISSSYIQEYIKQIAQELNKAGAQELYKIYDIKKINKYSYLIVIGFSLLDSVKLAKNFWYKIIPTIIITCGFLVYLKYR